MGSGSTKPHQSYEVTPAADPDADKVSADSAPALPAELADSLALLHSMTWQPDADPHAQWQTFASLVAQCQQHLPADDPAAETAVKQASVAFLNSVPPAQLQQWAADAGFDHPQLVGLSGKARHPLVHWLDPAYPADSPGKAKIQAAAHARYSELAAGGSVAGLTLADLPPPPTPTVAPDGGWVATPGEVVAAQAAVTDAVVAASTLPPHGQASGEDRTAALKAMLDAERHLATANCAELGGQLAVAQTAARHQIDAVLTQRPDLIRANVVAPLADQAHTDGQISGPATSWLLPADQVTLLRASTDPDHVAHLHELAQQRHHDVGQLHGLHASFLAGCPSPGHQVALAALSEGDSQLVDFAHTAESLYGKKAEVAGWANNTPGGKQLAATGGPANYYTHPSTPELTTQFRAWAKAQPLPALREAATALGMTDVAHATRADTQNYIAASWEPTIDKGQIQTKVSAKAATTKAAKAGGKLAATSAAPASPSAVAHSPAPVASPSPSATSAGSATAPSSRLGSGTWASTHQQMVSMLRHHAASVTALPAFTDSDVDTWTWTPAPAQSLGGAHRKQLYHGPAGSTWMFKPDEGAGGARAHAEVAANTVYSAVGIPAVAARVTKINGAVGCVQPMLSGSSNLSSDPSSWSQSDVDAIVRYHVGAWAVGDHDGKPDNMLRTASGGVVPVDAGQAFKFFGRDRLSTGYAPNAGHGVGQAVFHQAYKAAHHGQLGPGVKIRAAAAIPVLSAFHAIPDSQYRAMLHTTAHHGVRSNVHWVTPMREAAATRLHKPAPDVTADDIADQFLRTALARKHALRADFAAFFADLDPAGAHQLPQVT